MNKIKLVFGLVFGAVLATTAACSSPEVGQNDPDIEVSSTTEALTARCTVSGDPRVTKGCKDDEVCKVVACTDTVPPSCFGSCAAQPKPVGAARGCVGVFNCLCGTPVCIDGDWSCKGDCGGAGE